MNEDMSGWANCPGDILFNIFRKLDMKSLINSMFVNNYWRDVVEYYSQHFNIWEKMIEQGMDNKGWTFKEKSLLDRRDIILCARRWHHVKNSAAHLHNHYKFDVVRNICVHKDNLIVVTNNGIKYINIENFELLKSVNNSCLKYHESSSLIAELTLPNGDSMEYNTLTIRNKLHNKNCDCVVKKFVLFNISLFKLHLNCCYVIDINNVLWLYKAENCQLDVRTMAKYYGNRDSICGLHIYEQDVYVLLKRGDVLHVDLDCKKFEKVCHLDVPMHYLVTKPFIFSKCSVLCPVHPDTHFQVHTQKLKDQVVVACPRVTCAMEHGQVLLLGYEDGQIEIFLTKNLLKQSTKPEFELNLQNFSSISSKITAIDVYESKSAHHIFVVTECDVYEFLICDK